MRTAGVFEGESRTASVWVELIRPTSSARRPGQMARLALVTGRSTPTLAIPQLAIVRDGSEAFVFVENADGTSTDGPSW